MSNWYDIRNRFTNRGDNLVNTEAIKKLFKDLNLNMDDQITIKDLANMVVDLGIDEERDDHIEDQIRSVSSISMAVGTRGTGGYHITPCLSLEGPKVDV